MKKRSKRGERSRSKSNKKGVSHIEMIVSFSIFFLFVLFLFTYLNPVKPPSISKVLLDIVEQGLENYKAAILEIAVKVSGGGCFQIKCPFVDCTEDHIFVKDETGVNCGFTYASENLSISGTLKTFYYIYHSDKPVSHLGPTGCASFSAKSPTFSVPKLQTLYLHSELVKLNSTYYDNYEDLKTQFRFPSASDFSIRIYELDTLVFTMSVTKPKGIAVKARDMPIRILNGDTKEIIKGSMNIQVW